MAITLLYFVLFDRLPLPILKLEFPKFQVELTKEGDYSLYLLHVPLDLPGAPETRHLLVSGSNHMEGSSLNLLPKDLVQLDSGVIKLEVKHSTGKLLLRALWPEVSAETAAILQFPLDTYKFDVEH